MTRPPSIARFTLFWFASTALWGVGTLLGWERTRNALLRNPQTVAAADVAQWVGVGVVAVVSLLLWWLVAHRASRVGKWLVAAAGAFAGFRILLIVGGLLLGGAFHPLSQGAFTLASLLTIASAVMLFRPDAAEWFGEEPEADGEAQA
jgi:hypothetical protein